MDFTEIAAQLWTGLSSCTTPAPWYEQRAPVSISDSLLYKLHVSVISPAMATSWCSGVSQTQLFTYYVFHGEAYLKQPISELVWLRPSYVVYHTYKILVRQPCVIPSYIQHNGVHWSTFPSFALSISPFGYPYVYNIARSFLSIPPLHWVLHLLWFLALYWLYSDPQHLLSH